ncbi:response regulator [Aromatoleum toluvorans]|uniref:Response regulator n=1 Tax=Aromatoleum toluvorans TaxID=92002 RepID=A0ABX1PWZ6_9RHOO|nr:response regulator [Aromatoleum toluvorans]NMG42744.1 response regulator [Aromatoleum toluvorans]
MNGTARILVASDVAVDASLVRKLLSDEFENVSLSTLPDKSVEDFERVKPQVLVLAFNSLEKAERYYLGLYRLGTLVHGHPHRTLILCNKDDLKRVYELCKREYFDDYILFWPMTHDTPRLPMAVIHALRQMTAAGAGTPTARELAAQARHIAELEEQLRQYASKGGQQIEHVSRSFRHAGSEIGAAIDGFSRRMAMGEFRDVVEIKDQGGFERELSRLKTDEVERRLEEAGSAVRPLTLWIDSIEEAFRPQLQAARELQSLADRIPPVVLVVDDDELQHKLIGRLLGDMQLEILYASSGTEALGVLRRRRPDLILMDVNLPDFSGVEATRRLKSNAALANVPVVMITGRAEKSVVVDSLKAGAVDFVVKPVDRETLQGKLRSYLDLPAPSAG